LSVRYGERELKIMVVEDVEGMRSLIETVLQGIKGVRVSALVGTTIHARVELGRNRPELVLLDEVLPGESSVDLLQDLIRQQIPVLLMTGVEDPSHAIPEGAAGRILKPGWDSIEEDRIRFGAVISAVVGR
jgi:DNA-binding NtrC family response regulator